MPGSDGSGGAAAGTAGDPVDIARVAGGLVGGVFRGGTHGELVHVVLAQNNGPGLAQLLHGKGVIKGSVIFENARTGSCAQPLGGEGVLDRYRHTPQGLGRIGAFLVQGSGSGKCPFPVHGQHGRYARFCGVHARKAGRNGVNCAQFLFLQGLSRLCEREGTNFGHGVLKYVLHCGLRNAVRLGAVCVGAGDCAGLLHWPGQSNITLKLLYTMRGTMKYSPSASGALASTSLRSRRRADTSSRRGPGCWAGL